MALNTSPRKLVIPLSSGDESKTSLLHSTVPNITRRVFYCGVVVEGSENGRRLPDDIQDLVLSLGNPLLSEEFSEEMSSNQNESLNEIDKAAQRKRAMMDPEALAAVINELVTSERSYVKRLQILKHDYADPLKFFARSKDTAIIPLYQANTLFGNIDNILPVNEAFLADLEQVIVPGGSRAVGGVGDVALKHFKHLRGFEHYKQYYSKREEAQAIFEKEMSKRSSRFASYIDHIKYQSNDAKTRVGLRELLMEPVQRIPRYTLLFRTILKHMSPGDPQRAKILEADEIASKIAQAEADEQTKRAAIFYCLSTSIDGFPPELFSNSRKFIDCIDVEDVLMDAPVSSAASSTSNSVTSMNCTLFLFDDKLLIAKRPNNERGGRTLTGLDSVEKVTKAGGIPTGRRKSGMSYKGMIDITDVVVTDVGGAEIHLYLENTPQDQTERWLGRPFHSLFVVTPPMAINFDPVQTDSEKQRFLENLWKAQAMFRARVGQSVVLRSEEVEVESRHGKTTIAKTFFNVYQRTAFLQEPKKTKAVVHIDRDRHPVADPIPFGVNSPPFVVIRVHLMDGGLCRYSVRSSDPTDEEEEIVQIGKVPNRIIQTVHQFGLFQFKTGGNSVPSTPTARSKVAIFGLDAISRNLFNTRPGSMSEFFVGSINGKRSRSRSTASRTSMYTQTTTTLDSMKSSHRSMSTATAATSISTMDEDSFYASRSSKGKSVSNTKSRDGSPTESERGSLSRSHSRSQSTSRPQSRASSHEPDLEYGDAEDDTGTIQPKTKTSSSDYHLDTLLELARQNSLNQHNKPMAPLHVEVPVEETIYEEEPPFPVRPSSRASRSTRSTTPRPESPTKHLRSPSRASERKLMGPRDLSPLPPKSRVPPRVELPSMDDDLALEAINQLSDPSPHRLSSAIPRSRRQPFCPTGNTEATPKASNTIPATPVEPLSIKKKTSLRNSTVASPTPRKHYVRNSPLSRSLNRVVSPRRVSPGFKRMRGNGTTTFALSDDLEHLKCLSVSTKEDIETSRKSIKRIKLEVGGLKLQSTSSLEELSSRPSSPEKASRTPQSNASMTKEAQERMEEMRHLLKSRQGEGTPLRRRIGTVFETPSNQTPNGTSNNVAGSLDVLVTEADKVLVKAIKNQDILQDELTRLSEEFKQRAIEFERTRLELQNSKRQCELVKSLLSDATAEKDIMYGAFNEELDGMYNDANLPDDEAWHALSSDLRNTKESRNGLSRENSQLKAKLAELELEKEEWGDLLRMNGLIP